MVFLESAAHWIQERKHVNLFIFPVQTLLRFCFVQNNEEKKKEEKEEEFDEGEICDCVPLFAYVGTDIEYLRLIQLYNWSVYDKVISRNVTFVSSLIIHFNGKQKNVLALLVFLLLTKKKKIKSSLLYTHT